MLTPHIYVALGWLGWSLTSLFSTNAAISETNVWRYSNGHVLM